MTDASSIGSMTAAAVRLTKVDSGGWELWEKIARGRPELGNPAPFNSSIPESYWLSFTVTCHDAAFFDQMEAFSGNKAGIGGLVTFKDSNWLMSVVLYHQPHFADQQPNTQVFWGYGLHCDRIGNFVAKPMSDCSGAEILQEICGHLYFDPSRVRRCDLPSMPHAVHHEHVHAAHEDRSASAGSQNSINLALVSQFVRNRRRRGVHRRVFGARRADGSLSVDERSSARPARDASRQSLAVIFATLEKAFT